MFTSNQAEYGRHPAEDLVWKTAGENNHDHHGNQDADPSNQLQRQRGQKIVIVICVIQENYISTTTTSEANWKGGRGDRTNKKLLPQFSLPNTVIFSSVFLFSQKTPMYYSSAKFSSSAREGIHNISCLSTYIYKYLNFHFGIVLLNLNSSKWLVYFKKIHKDFLDIDFKSRLSLWLIMWYQRTPLTEGMIRCPRH